MLFVTCMDVMCLPCDLSVAERTIVDHTG